MSALRQFGASVGVDDENGLALVVQCSTQSWTIPHDRIEPFFEALLKLDWLPAERDLFETTRAMARAAVVAIERLSAAGRA